MDVLTPRPQNVTVFRGRALFKEVMKVKGDHMSGFHSHMIYVLIRRHAQRKDHVKTKGEDGDLQAKERGLRMKAIFQTP